jgi:hypothetical protein
MLSLSHKYQLAGTNEEKVMLTKYKGTAFGVYYILNGLSLILFSLAMLKTNIFGRKVAKIGSIGGILMLVPTTVRLVGMIFGLTSLIPTSIWLVIIAKRLNILAKAD